MGILKKLFFLLNLCCVLMLLLSYISPHYSIESIWPLNGLGLLYPYLLILNLAFLAVWLITDFRRMWLSLIAILIGWTQLTSFVTLNTRHSEKDDLQIMSYNISNGAFYNDKNKTVKVDIKTITNYIRKRKNIDVVCIQEGSKNVYDVFRKELSAYDGVYINDRRAMIFSRLPIVDKGLIDFKTKINSAVWADIKKGGKVFRVYSLHLASNALTRTATEVINDTDLQERRTWGKIKTMTEKYKQGSIRREEQAREIRKHSDASPHPVIICGDFNDIPQSHVYTILSKDMKDSFTEGGLGIGTSFRGSIPLLRIDYILTSPEIEVQSFDVPKKKYSDHYPIVSRLKI